MDDTLPHTLINSSSFLSASSVITVEQVEVMSCKSSENQRWTETFCVDTQSELYLWLQGFSWPKSDLSPVTLSPESKTQKHKNTSL